MSYVPASIDVYVGDASKYTNRPSAERIRSRLSSESSWPRFELLERSAIQIAGVQAELISYQTNAFFAPVPLEYHTKVAFDRNGMQWDIEAMARDADIAAAVRADFDHVLETLKIVE